jgi:hypothetical protein
MPRVGKVKSSHPSCDEVLVSIRLIWQHSTDELLLVRKVMGS